MKFLSRYIELNGGGLMLMRRFCGIWFKYQPFDNKLNKVENEMNSLAEKFEAKCTEHRELMKQANQIRKEIEASRESEKAHGTPFIASLPLFPFKHRATAKPHDKWRKYARVVEGRTATVAETIVGSGHGINAVSLSGGVDLYDPRGHHDTDTDTLEVVGGRAMPITPRRQNNNQKNQNNQKNNQQNGNN